MSKKLRNLYIGLAVLLVLGGAVLVLLLTQPQTDDGTASDVEPPAITLVEEDPNDCASIEITNPTGSYTILQVGEELWKIEGMESYEHRTEQVTATVTQLSAFGAEQKIFDQVNSADLANYGLAEPTTAVLRYENGNTYTLQVGDMLVDSTGYYARIEGDEALYVISTSLAGRLSNTFGYYINKELLPLYDTDGDELTEETPTIESLKMTRKDLEAPIVIVKDEAEEGTVDYKASSIGLYMTSPVRADLVADMPNEYIYTLFDTTGKDVVSGDAKNHLAEYGLDDPFAVIELVYDGGMATFTMGAPVEGQEGSYYCTYNDHDLVYVVTADHFPLLAADPNDMIAKLLYVIPNINYVEGIDLTVDGQSYSFETSFEKTEGEETNGVITALYNGEELDSAQFAQFYQTLLGVQFDKIAEEVPDYISEIDPTVGITYHYTDGDQDTVFLYDIGQRSMLLGVNGSVDFVGPSTQLDKIREGLAGLIG